MMNRLLARQIKKTLGRNVEISENLEKLLITISSTYDDNEQERKLNQRTLDVSSTELVSANETLERQKGALEKATRELDKANALKEAYLELEKTQIYLKEKNEELQASEEEIRQNNEELTSMHEHMKLSEANLKKALEKLYSSINYAQKIQKSILPQSDYVNEFFKESFILYLPKDIVSGDFYWLGEKDNKVFFAVADCTGHGVPAAFMSLICINLLNNLLFMQDISSPVEILSALRMEIIGQLNQAETQNKDGLDISLCMVDLEKKELKFSGNYIGFAYIQDDELISVKGDKVHIGGLFNMKNHNQLDQKFTEITIKIDKPTTIYLYSDGYQDQFGGKDDRKFLSKNFRQLLSEVHTLPMAQQKDILHQTISDWKGKRNQLDDITVWGIQL